MATTKDIKCPKCGKVVRMTLRGLQGHRRRTDDSMPIGLQHEGLAMPETRQELLTLQIRGRCNADVHCPFPFWL